MPRILVLYGTTDGHTAKVAAALAETLHIEGAVVDVVDAGARVPPPGPDGYAAVIVAASVHASGYQAKVRRWVRTHLRELSGRPTAFVSVCLGVLQHDPAVDRELQAILRRFYADTGWRPTVTKIVAGALRYTRYGWLKRFVMRRISAKAHGDIDTSRDYEYTDWTDLKGFARDFLLQVNLPEATFGDGQKERVAMPRAAVRSLALVSALAALFAAFFLVVRPWYLGWGATAEETVAELPGDEIIPYAASQQTRAITIHAPIDRVWPWVAQIGQDRGGFYSFDLLENLIGCEMPTTDVLQPDRQFRQLGDKLWMYPPEKAGGVGFATLRTYRPGRALGFATHMTGTPIDMPEDGSWSFVLEPVDAATTRCIARGRGVARHSLLGAAFDRGIFEPIHFMMERRMLIGLQQLAEGQDRHRFANHAQVVVSAIAFALIVTFAILALRRERWARPLAGFVVAAIVFQVLTFVQPSIWIGQALLAVAVLAGRTPAGPRRV